ncbi:MAG: hypothetical protein GY719_31600 [bacterium]|nr:hypothetical protein [bacterium]
MNIKPAQYTTTDLHPAALRDLAEGAFAAHHGPMVLVGLLRRSNGTTSVIGLREDWPFSAGMFLAESILAAVGMGLVEEAADGAVLHTTRNPL